MMTVKIIDYPENGIKTTRVYETAVAKISEAYLPEFGDGIENNTDDKFGYMNGQQRDKLWCALLYSDAGLFLLLPNAEVYIMSDGKTIASHKSIIID
jgi:hypothetical protein